MKIVHYVVEAAEALEAPGELRQFLTNFAYDPEDKEWFFDTPHFAESNFLKEARTWGHKICGWLQFKYPGGPHWHGKN